MGKASQQAAAERRIVLLRALGWDHLADAAADGLRDAFPPAWPLF